MSHRRTVVAAAAFLAAATALALAAPAQAAPARPPLFQATAAGTAVDLVGGTVTSGPAASTAVRTRATTQRSAASATAVNVPGVLHTGAISSDSSTARNAADTATVVSGHARTTGISVLAGVITADAIDTTSALIVTGNKVTARAVTRFTNLRISGNAVIRGEVDPNTTIEIPGVARVVLNASGSVPGTTSGLAVSTAVIVTLLSDTLAGSTLAINPTTAQTQRVGLGYAPLGGLALGAQVTVASDGSASAGPFGAIGMPDVGTGGQTLTDTLAGVDLPSLGALGTVSSTANGLVSDAQSRSTMQARVANVNLLGGLVTAKTLVAQAEVKIRAGQDPVPTASVTFTGLKIAGVPVPIDAAPGLIVPLPGVGAVAIRATATTPTAAAAAALTITLSADAFGLPAGATIQIGFAYASLLS